MDETTPHPYSKTLRVASWPTLTATTANGSGKARPALPEYYLVYEPAKTGVTTPRIGELEFLHLAATYGTPLYLIDQDTLLKKVEELRQAYSRFAGPVSIAYSLKANFNPTVLKILAKSGVMFDVAQLGELSFLLRSGGNPENVVYTSVTEEGWEYEEVLKTGVKRIVVSSYNGLYSLVSVASGIGFKPSVMVRVNPEVGVKAEVRASYRHSKFGVPFNNNGSKDSAVSLVRTIMSSENVIFEGFHFHLGSQISDPKCFISAIDKLENFVFKVRREFPNLAVRAVDIGGGTPVCYGPPVPAVSEFGALITARLNRMADDIGNNFELMIESGRFLSAEAGMLISKIVNMKGNGEHKLAILDAGYHVLLDAALLRQEYPQTIVPAGNRDTSESQGQVTLVGRLCDTYDYFPVSPESKLDRAEIGKLVVFHNVGAYSIVFNMPFHCQTKPPVVLRRVDGSYALVRKGQTVSELYIEEGGDSLLEP